MADSNASDDGLGHDGTFVEKDGAVFDVEEISDNASDTFVRVRRKWKTAMVQPTDIHEKPWLEKVDPRKKWEKIIFAAGCLIGTGIGIGIILFYYFKVTDSKYCQVLHDSFSTIDSTVWTHEIQLDGFGTGSFDWTTDDPRNSYVDSQGLHIVPSLTVNDTSITTEELANGYTLNLGFDCTSSNTDACVVESDSSTGIIIPPVRSSRLTTKGKVAIKYGRVEVRAKMPKGDWLWPAIRLLPEDDVYGAWPASGEIDIAEARGNAASWEGGRNQYTSTLHWGPDSDDDESWRTIGGHKERRTAYSEAFHTYGVEWSEKYIFCYLDSRLLQVLFIKFSEKNTLWDQGKFTEKVNSTLVNPWSGGGPNAPFDQHFYLSLSVQAGGTDGFFPDKTGKPWTNDDDYAASEFWGAQDEWYKTWKDDETRGITVESVKIESLGACAS